MAILVILILLALWGAVLLPPILRARAESGSAPGGIGDFVGRLRSGLGQGRHHDGALPPLQPIMGPVGGPSPALGTGMRAPGGMSQMQRRRRDVLIGLLAAAGLTFLMAFMAGSIVFWVFQLLADALLAGYVYLLLQAQGEAPAAPPAVATRAAPDPDAGPEQRAPSRPDAPPHRRDPVARRGAARGDGPRAPTHRHLVAIARVDSRRQRIPKLATRALR